MAGTMSGTIAGFFASCMACGMASGMACGIAGATTGHTVGAMASPLATVGAMASVLATVSRRHAAVPECALDIPRASRCLCTLRTACALLACLSARRRRATICLFLACPAVRPPPRGRPSWQLACSAQRCHLSCGTLTAVHTTWLHAVGGGSAAPATGRVREGGGDRGERGGEDERGCCLRKALRRALTIGSRAGRDARGSAEQAAGWGLDVARAAEVWRSMGAAEARMGGRRGACRRHRRCGPVSRSGRGRKGSPSKNMRPCTREKIARRSAR
eukprot:354578-Chlamydomonas_euryale.AAC.4